MPLKGNLRGRFLLPLHANMLERNMTMSVPGFAVLKDKVPVEQRYYCLVPENYPLLGVAFTDKIL